jgi:mannose-6-phosphate isomerase
MQETSDFPSNQDGAARAVYPLTFQPAFKDYPWGGRRLATELGRTIPDGIVAESWDIAGHPNGSSVVREGALAGLTLPQVLTRWGEDLVGSRNAKAVESGKFPLLIKILDANSWLSVQVHPEDAYALEHEGEFGKTEMWVVLRAEPGSELIYGFRPGANREAFAKAIAEGSTEEWLHRLIVKPGDVVYVPAGTVHALGPGVMVAEIQQNSDTTYRIYDWGRERPLHIRQSLDVLDFDNVEPAAYAPVEIAGGGPRRELIGECAYFRTERVFLQDGEYFAGQCDGSTFEIWGVLDGSVDITSDGGGVQLRAVDWTLLPAALGPFEVTANGDATVLRVVTPPNEEQA